ncbi:MAG TPA: acetyl-CoA synthetase, partial [bacterium]|nr:acetyl-CoA synthetase [bacterium]
MKRRWIVIAVLTLAAAAFGDEARLLRQPHISQDKVVFMVAGDLYTVPIEGGTARKLTSFEGYEIFPKFSPDGKWIAFSGEYAGTRQIYVIPSKGGVPKQLTFYPDVGPMPPRGGYDNLVFDWTPDGKKILVKSNRTPYGQRIGRYFLVDPFQESLEQPLQIPEGAPATFSPDGKKLAYSIISREFRTWKRYKAGRAQDIWIYDLEKNTIDQLTDYAGTDNFPMWVDNTIFFTSDRKTVDSDEPRTLNIFAYDIQSKVIRQVTDFKEYDCLWPSRGKGGIVFENGGYIHILDPKTEKTRKLTVYIHDDKPLTRPYYKKVDGFIESWYPSPSGKRALFSARGDLFTVPAEHGFTVNISQTPSVREIAVDWSPDGKYISYAAETGKDYELFIREYHTDKPAVQLTKNTGAWILGYLWSPDSKSIAVSDKSNRLRLVDVESRKVTVIDQCKLGGYGGFSWSPDSKYIAYSRPASNYLNHIWIYSVEDGKSTQLTRNDRNDFNPVFGDDGKTVSFVSARDFNYQNQNFRTRLYIGTLKADMKSPFAPLNDDEPEKKEEEDKKGKTNDRKDDKKEEKKVEPLIIDFDGFDTRVVAYPLPAAGYGNVKAVKGGLVYVKNGALHKYDMGERKESKIMDGVRNYELTADGKKFMYQAGKDFGIADLRPGQKSGAGKLDLSNMEMKIDPKIEWKQIYTDAWRIMRDWFYDPGLHGVDWDKMYRKYAVLVDHAAHRAELDYILGELIGELNAGHTYVMPGERDQVPRVDVGLLGCEFEPDQGFYKIARIFEGENYRDNRRSPLTEAGVDVREGEYLIAVNGHTVKTDENPYKFLENKAGREVTLLINSRPSEQGAREVVVRPIASELTLRHYNWVLNNRRIVDQLSNGRIGYIYVPNTAFEGNEEFYRGWAAQHNKDALIIDDRYNGGGYSPARMAFDMAAPLLQYWARRHTEMTPQPFLNHQGPKVMLINGYSSSGGDAFPDYFRTLELGPLMGKTTWGGLIGYGYSPRFVDEGWMAVPQSAYVNTEGEWDVEYYGVEPDIEVFDDPTLIQAGREPMLERAVEYLLEELKTKTPVRPKTPKGPIR